MTDENEDNEEIYKLTRAWIYISNLHLLVLKK